MNQAHSIQHLQDQPGSGLWTIQELAKFLRCSERHVYILRRQGLPAIAVGGLVRFDQERVRRWLETSSVVNLGPGERAKGRERAERVAHLAAIAETGDEDNVECAAADLAREFPEPAT